KRAPMGRAVAALADVAVVTNDNPRSEDPAAIVDAILPGLEGARAVVVELDRRRAIAGAIQGARAGDVVLVAGKGHETYQIDGHAFVEQAEARGARTMVVSRDDLAAEKAIVRVSDTKKALGDLARAHRARWDGTLVAITGSAGKTTTKNVLARMLGAVAGDAVHASAGNLNNDLG